METVEPELAAQLEQEITREVLLEIREDADIVLYGPDGEPLPEDGAVEGDDAEGETGDDAPAE